MRDDFPAVGGSAARRGRPGALWALRRGIQRALTPRRAAERIRDRRIAARIGDARRPDPAIAAATARTRRAGGGRIRRIWTARASRLRTSKCKACMRRRTKKKTRPWNSRCRRASSIGSSSKASAKGRSSRRCVRCRAMLALRKSSAWRSPRMCAESCSVPPPRAPPPQGLPPRALPPRALLTQEPARPSTNPWETVAPSRKPCCSGRRSRGAEQGSGPRRPRCSPSRWPLRSCIATASGSPRTHRSAQCCVRPMRASAVR